MAKARPNLSFIFIGPISKISPDDLPKAPNIHYLGQKSYTELPAYLSGWDVALMPFAINEATKFISPTKTPEYLAAGRPVVSTAITVWCVITVMWVAYFWLETPMILLRHAKVRLP
ncbi:hypothetical protein T190_31115 [Sinorhizobium meliloti CCBAU 01290]|nr:hypothetical protein T190_31115 [Sinorhizobium meliloti CCBAU 01290]